MPSAKTPPAVNYPVTPRQVFFIVSVAATAACCGSTNGWSAVLPRLQHDHSRFTVTDQEVAWLVSMTSLVVIVVSPVTGPLVEFLGPRLQLQLSLLLAAASWLTMAFTPLKWLLYVGRAGVAAGVAFILSLLQPLLVEMSPPKIRGLASSLPEVCASLGMLLAFILASFFPWHVATALCALPPVILFLPLLFVPESPYWLVRRDRTQDARTSLTRLRGRRDGVEEELTTLLNAPTAVQSSVKEQFVLLRKGRNLRPVVVVTTLFTLRELGGRSTILQYAVYIFQAAGVDMDPFTCTIMLGTIRVVCVCVSALVLDRVGRRPLLITSALVCGAVLGAAGVFLYLELPGASWVPLVSLLVYIGSYGLGVGPVPWVLQGELLPSPVRSVGASIVVLVNTAAVFGISFVFLVVVAKLGLGPTLITLGVCTLLVGGVAWRWVPETRGATLSQLETAFSTRAKNKEEVMDSECEEEITIDGLNESL